MMLKYLLPLLFVVCVLFQEGAQAAQQSGSLIKVSAQGTLEIQWRGRTIASDLLRVVPAKELEKPEGFREETIDGATVSNSWKTSHPEKEVTYRREVVQDQDGIELTMEFRVPAYYFEGRPEELESFYSLLIPYDQLEGIAYRAVVRQGSGTRTLSGTISKGRPQGLPKDGGRQIVYLTLEDKEGKTVSFDFAPAGVAVFNGNTAASNLPDAWWGGLNQENGIRASIGRRKASTAPYNGVYIGKVRITEGGFEDYKRLRAHQRYQYYMELFPTRQFCFGHNAPPDAWEEGKVREITESDWLSARSQYDFWTPAGTLAFTPERGFGWQTPDGVTLEDDSSRGVLHGRAAGRTPQSFLLRASEPGVYLFTVRTAAGQQAAGPFSLAAGGKPAVEDLTVTPGKVAVMTFARYLQAGAADLEFSGNWAVSTIAVQKLLHAAEDFSIARRFWTAPSIPTPTALHQFEPGAIPAQAAIQTFALNPEPPAAAHPSTDFIAFDFQSEANRWLWESNIAALGPGNTGSFYEFETDEQIRRRLDELQRGNYNTVLLNGLLIRHAFLHEEERIANTIARIVAQAHERGMKVLDHFDVTLIPNMGVAYPQMLQHLDWTLKDVSNNQVTRGYCMNHPGFRKQFIERVVEHIRKTGIDGIMLDEVSFHRFNFCGCEHCREKFSRETGAVFPLDGVGGEVQNPESRIWKQWVAWRADAVQDFRVELMREFQKLNPHFVFMMYGAESTFARPKRGDGSKAGGRQENNWRSSSFRGIEMLGNNLYATYRSNLAVGTLFNSLGGTDLKPGFGLIYHNHQPVVAYAGWAMNNMNNLRTWLIQGNREIEADAPRYLGWKDNMTAHRAVRIADIALLASADSRTLSGNSEAYQKELLGMCEQLDDLHLPYQVVQDEFVTPEWLASQRLVILPGTPALRDETVQLLHRYLQEGGHVVATGPAVTEDQLGFKRKSWPLGEWLDLQPAEPPIGKPVLRVTITRDRKESLSLPVAIGARLGTTAPPEVLAWFENDGASPAIVEKTIGLGRLFWAAPSLGTENYEPDSSGGRKWEFHSNPAARKLLGRLAARARGETPIFQAVEIPSTVKIRIYTEPGEGGEVLTYVHFYNGGGALRKGKTVPTAPPADPFPEIADEMAFEIALPAGEATGEFVSPDFPEKRPVSMTPLGNGRHRITLPAGTLKAYGMVRIRQTPARASR